MVHLHVLQDFERKSALFSLASSEILIVNLWEHQVGLYQGANMGLLKTVFEVNLGLFGKTGYVTPYRHETRPNDMQNKSANPATLRHSGPCRRYPIGQLAIYSQR